MTGLNPPAIEVNGYSPISIRKLLTCTHLHRLVVDPVLRIVSSPLPRMAPGWIPVDVTCAGQSSAKNGTNDLAI